MKMATMIFLAAASLPLVAGESTGSERPDETQAAKVARFAVCPGNILKAEVGGGVEEGREWVEIQIVLDESGSRELLIFSEVHLGEVAEVVYDGAVLLRAPIASRLSGGNIASHPWFSARAAAGMVSLMRDATIEVPCGALPPAGN